MSLTKVVLHLEKRAIRALGIAESFREDEEFSTIAGLVMRSDLVIDGILFGRSRVGGTDSTKVMVKLFKRLKRNDVNAVLLSGSILSFYNIVDVDALHSELRLPIIALTFKKSKSDLERNIRARFAGRVASSKLRLLRKLGEPVSVSLSTGYQVFVRTCGISERDAKRLLDRFTLQGAIPEPVRIARLIARAGAKLSR